MNRPHTLPFTLFAVVSFGLPMPIAAQAWIELSNDPTLEAWMTLDGTPVTDGWEFVDGVIHRNVEGQRAGHIVTKQEYTDFDLSFEWKIATRGNSGIKYRVQKFGNRVLGCEYQILDDQTHRDGQSSKKSTGSLYDVYEPNGAKYVRPPGEYNQGRVVVRRQRIEHWLNGHLILVAQVGSPEWLRRIADSKFADVDGFGKNRQGRIMLTDHGSEVWYRNIVLRELAAPDQRTVSRPSIDYERTCRHWPSRRAGRFLGRWRCRVWRR